MNEPGIAELAASLKATGMIQPIIVRKVGETYQLIAGERRWRASKLAGLTTIPAILREVDSFTQAQMALVENIQRENLNPIDRAQAYRTLMAQLGLTQAELAGRLGEDRSSIANHLRLLDLPEPVQAMISDGRLSLGHAKILAGVPDILEQERLANLVLTQGLSVRNLERLLQDGGTRPAAPPAAAPAGSAHLLDLEKSLSRQLGMKCLLRAAAKKGKGRLIINYASLDQFDELMSRLGVSAEA
jgi:ParB family chromosome partitioning protein